jgi:hypothetical protein
MFPRPPVVPRNARPDMYNVYELEGDYPAPAVENQEAPAGLPAWPPSPRDPVPRRVRFPDEENLQPRQIGEEVHRQQLFILAQHIEALQDSRNHYHRQAWNANTMLNNLQYSHRLLEAELQEFRQMEGRTQDDLRRVQDESARLQAENARLRIERDRARDSLVGVLQPYGGRPMFSPRN